MASQYSSLHELLRHQLLAARKLDQQSRDASNAGLMLEIPQTGKIVSSAYEQLRNAAEYAEEHLLLQRAIKRYCRRNLFFAKRKSHKLGNELIVDSTASLRATCAPTKT
jgi:DNA-directed RNA polymerase subunit N (RpoN/RPB10)